MIKSLPYETLFQIYQDSVKYSLEKEFIEMLEKELERRKTMSMIDPLPHNESTDYA